jgi:copper chaperone CopZ
MRREASTESQKTRRVQCPACGTKAKRVSGTTLRGVLKDEFAARIVAVDGAGCRSQGQACRPIPEDTGWRFCDSPECDVVYFSEQGDARFTRSQLKVAVGVKETTGERPLCYCFGHSVASIKEELRTKGRSDALDDIRAKMKSPGCFCETSNPSGTCCLGSVARGIRIAQEELGADGGSRRVAAAGSSRMRGESIAKIGTLVSALMASACCWLPLLLLAVGVSGAGIAAALESYRPLFTVVTVGFLAAAFYLTYRPRKGAAADGGCCSAARWSDEELPVDGCAQRPAARSRMRAMNKVMLWAVTVLAVAFLLFPNYVGLLIASRHDGTPSAAESPLVAITAIRVEGMSCPGCAAALEARLKDVPGVQDARVDYSRNQVLLSTERCCAFPKQRVLGVIRESGFEGHIP